MAALALLLRLVYGPGDLGFDAAFSLVWGDELRHLHGLDYGAVVTPTPHPLANVVAALASFAGDAGPTILLVLSFLSFAAVGVIAFVVGRRGFGTAAGIVLAAILLTRPLLVAEALQASIDIPFLALLLGALALELGRSRRGGPVLVTLALAGLLRPEAWLLSFCYLVYLLAPPAARGDRRHVLRMAALAAAGPFLWLLGDLVTAGNPLQSFTRTQDLAAHLERERGTRAAVRDLPADLRSVLGGWVTWVGISVGAVMLLAAQRRARLPLALLVLGLVTFLALGAAQLPLLNRYLLEPSLAVSIFCAAGVTAWSWLELPWRRSRVGAVVSVAAAAALLASIPSTRVDVRGNLAHANERNAIYDGLLTLADTARARGLVRSCPPVQAAVYRPVPVLAYRLGIAPSSIRVVRPHRARRGLMFAADLDSVIGDVGLYPGVVIPQGQLTLPASFSTVQANDWGRLATSACPPPARPAG